MSKWIVKFTGHDNIERKTQPFSSLASAHLAELIIDGYPMIKSVKVELITVVKNGDN